MVTDQDKSEHQRVEEPDETRQRFRETEGARIPFGPGSRIWWALIANTPVFILVLDTDGRIRFVNRTDSGATPDQVLGRTLCDFCRPEDRERVRTCVESVVRTGKPAVCEGRALRLDREEHWYESHLAPIFDEGKVVGVSVISVNATERKRAEEALEESREELMQVASSISDYLWSATVDQTGNVAYRYYSPVIERITGRPPEFFMTGPQAWLSTVHPDDRPRLARAAARITAGQSARETEEYRIIRPDGTICWVLGNTTARPMPDGTLRLCGTVSDITERREVEERNRVQQALRHSNDELQAIYDNMADGLLIADCATGRFLRTNPAMCQMLGYSADELLSMSVADIHPPEDVPGILERFGTQPEGKRIVTQSRAVLRRNRTVFYADISNIRVSLHGRPCIIGLFRDITERKRMIEALQQGHDELRAIHDQIVDGILVADAETLKPVRANAAYCRMLGYSREEIYSVSPERLHTPDELPRAWEHFDTVTEGFVARTEDMPFLRKDGNVIYLDVVSSPICYNERPCWISFFHDVTERKRAQEALERQHRTLKHLLQSSDHERQTIAYEIHDGLAQQLAGAIMQFDTYVYQKEKEPKFAAKAFEAGLTMLRQGYAEARRLISGVRPPILDEEGVVAAIAHLVNEERRKKGPKIEYLSKVEFHRLTPILENAIYRIVQEALTNACRHSESPRAEVQLVQHGDMVRIEVRDRGKGFKPEEIEERHFGVAGIRERARLLGGSATIDSEPGNGTRIVVELPVVLRREEDAC